MVEYKYDAWGRATYASDQLPISNWLCLLNPFRYRGYIYDSETGMYWLRSRYYYPELHRFISADNVMDGAGLFSANLYAYCKNAPVNREDQNGHADAAIYSEDRYEKNYRYAGGGGSSGKFIGPVIGIALGLGISVPLYKTNGKHVTQSRAESTIGSDSEVDGKYYVAIALWDAFPILIPKAMNFHEALIAARVQLTAETVLDIFYETYPFAQRMQKVAAFGIYTRREKDAEKLASKLGRYEYDWHGIGLRHYNIRNYIGIHNEIHIWFFF